MQGLHNPLQSAHRSAAWKSCNKGIQRGTVGRHFCSRRLILARQPGKSFELAELPAAGQATRTARARRLLSGLRGDHPTPRRLSPWRCTGPALTAATPAMQHGRIWWFGVEIPLAVGRKQRGGESALDKIISKKRNTRKRSSLKIEPKWLRMVCVDCVYYFRVIHWCDV